MSLSAYLAPFILLYASQAMVDAQNQTNFICNDSNDCSQQTLTCDPSAHCSITCEGSTAPSCNTSTILCPFGPYACNVVCAATVSQCEYTRIDASNMVGADLTINVDANGAQYGLAFAHVKCPISGNCFITVASWHGRALWGSTIDASHTISGDLAILYRDGNDRNAQEMAVQCPSNGDCMIDVGVAWGSCTGCKITAQATTTLLSIRATGTEALRNATITCPQRAHTGSAINCIIYIADNYLGVIQNLQIYSVESFTNLQLTALKYDGTPATMHCMDDYQETCEVERVSATKWKCKSAQSVCENWVAPTQATHIPSWQPTSREPTSIPTPSPSRLPTHMPSFSPTEAPTNAPSDQPSQIHSNNPSDSPTDAPFTEHRDYVSTRYEKAHVNNTDPLSMSTIVAIAVSIVIGLLIILLSIVLLCRYGRIKPDKSAQNDQNMVQKVVENECGMMDAVPKRVNNDDESSADVIIICERQQAIQIVDDNEDKLEKEAVKMWLTDIAKLPQYYRLFVENGYDTIRIIATIKDKSELQEMKITLAGHQTRIIQEINRLNEKTIVKKGEESKSGDVDRQITYEEVEPITVEGVDDAGD